MLIANWPGRLLSASQLSQVHFLYHIVTSEERNCSACLTLRPSHRKSSSWSLAKFECNIVLCFCLLWHVCLLRKATEKTNLFVIWDYFLAQRTSFLLLELWISQIFSVRPSWHVRVTSRSLTALVLQPHSNLHPQPTNRPKQGNIYEWKRKTQKEMI